VIGDRDRSQDDQPSANTQAARTVANRTTKKAAKHGSRKLLIAVGVKGGFWVGLVVLLLLVIGAMMGTFVGYLQGVLVELAPHS